MKTLTDLARYVEEKEKELAYGSETTILGAFVDEFDYTDAIISGDTLLNPDQDVTKAYSQYVEAYSCYKK